MKKMKLYEVRKQKSFSQRKIAACLCMDVSNYNRREMGQVEISIAEWQKLAKILEVPLEKIYEPDGRQTLITQDGGLSDQQETNRTCSVPECLLTTQQKYIRKLEKEIAELRTLLKKKIKCLEQESILLP
jgi:transcriptional regulator with XRE-family HTH domain